MSTVSITKESALAELYSDIKLLAEKYNTKSISFRSTGLLSVEFIKRFTEKFMISDISDGRIFINEALSDENLTSRWRQAILLASSVLPKDNPLVMPVAFKLAADLYSSNDIVIGKLMKVRQPYGTMLSYQRLSKFHKSRDKELTSDDINKLLPTWNILKKYIVVSSILSPPEDKFIEKCESMKDWYESYRKSPKLSNELHFGALSISDFDPSRIKLRGEIYSGYNRTKSIHRRVIKRDKLNRVIIYRILRFLINEYMIVFKDHYVMRCYRVNRSTLMIDTILGSSNKHSDLTNVIRRSLSDDEEVLRVLSVYINQGDFIGVNLVTRQRGFITINILKEACRREH
jgi:hypothetical protein